MADKNSYTCIGICRKTFSFGDWECFPGEPHKVEPKTYYMADAPHVDVKNDPDGLALRSSRTTLHCVPDVRIEDPLTHQVGTIHHPGCTFAMGQYTTQDPKEQFFIERSGHTVSYERWFDAYHTPKMKQNIKDGRLLERERNVAAREAEADRKIKEANSLLDQVKGKQKERASA